MRQGAPANPLPLVKAYALAYQELLTIRSIHDLVDSDEDLARMVDGSRAEVSSAGAGVRRWSVPTPTAAPPDRCAGSLLAATSAAPWLEAATDGGAGDAVAELGSVDS